MINKLEGNNEQNDAPNDDAVTSPNVSIPLCAVCPNINAAESSSIFPNDNISGIAATYPNGSSTIMVLLLPLLMVTSL